jgi:hypothetical protein
LLPSTRLPSPLLRLFTSTALLLLGCVVTMMSPGGHACGN